MYLRAIGRGLRYAGFSVFWHTFQQGTLRVTFGWHVFLLPLKVTVEHMHHALLLVN